MTRLEQSIEKAHSVLNHDFCPWANRWVYWMKHPVAPLGTAALVAGCCGAFVNSIGFVMLGAMVCIGGLGAIWPWITVRGLTAHAEFLQTRCCVGQSVLVRLRISNHLPWPAWGLSVRRGFHQDLTEHAGISLARISGWSETEFEWLFTPDWRGCYPCETAQIDTGFPFGLWHVYVPIQMQNELLVWPESVALDAMPDAAEIQTREDQLTDRRSGHAGDLVGVRPFRDGDSLRRVHWQQTARTGRLIVIERQAPATCAVRLVVDLGRLQHRIEGRESSLEACLSITASVLESLHRQHALVELEIHEERITVGESQSSLRQALDALARVPREGVACSHSCHFDHPSRHLPTIAVTSDLALAHHRGHRHTSFGERFVVVRTSKETDHEKSQPGCDCHAWVEVATNEVLGEVLPNRWRRACHAA